MWIGDVPDPRASHRHRHLRGEPATWVLTDGARADSVPNLEIGPARSSAPGTPDATGRFRRAGVFYLQARGIPGTRPAAWWSGASSAGHPEIAVPEVRERLTAAIEHELGLRPKRRRSNHEPTLDIRGSASPSTTRCGTSRRSPPKGVNPDREKSGRDPRSRANLVRSRSGDAVVRCHRRPPKYTVTSGSITLDGAGRAVRDERHGRARSGRAPLAMQVPRRGPPAAAFVICRASCTAATTRSAGEAAELRLTRVRSGPEAAMAGSGSTRLVRRAPASTRASPVVREEAPRDHRSWALPESVAILDPRPDSGPGRRRAARRSAGRQPVRRGRACRRAADHRTTPHPALHHPQFVHVCFDGASSPPAVELATNSGARA